MGEVAYSDFDPVVDPRLALNPTDPVWSGSVYRLAICPHP